MASVATRRDAPAARRGKSGPLGQHITRVGGGLWHNRRRSVHDRGRPHGADCEQENLAGGALDRRGPDPLRGQANLYAYVDNGPVNRVDPSGLEWDTWMFLPDGHRVGIDSFNIEDGTVMIMDGSKLEVQLAVGL